MCFLIYVVQLINQEPGGFAFWLNPFGPAEWDGCPHPPRVHSHHVTFCWAGFLAKAPPGNSVKHQHSLPKPQVAVWRYRGDQGASQPMCQAWWFLGNCETEDVRMVSWWKRGGAAQPGFSGAHILGSEGLMQGTHGRAPRVCWLGDVPPGHVERPVT